MKFPTTKVRQNCCLLEKSKEVEHVDAELVKIVSAAFVSQSTSFKTASMHCPLVPTICTLWDQVEEDEDLLVVVVVVVVIDVDPEVELATYPGGVSPKLLLSGTLGALESLGAFDILGVFDTLVDGFVSMVATVFPGELLVMTDLL
jgi:hypothetical protein